MSFAQGDLQTSLWVLACFLSTWSAQHSNGQSQADAGMPGVASIDNMAPIYTTMRLVGTRTSNLQPAEASSHVGGLADLLSDTALSTDR